MAKKRPPALIDGWLPAGARLLERHETKVPAVAATAYEAATEVTLGEMPVVRALFRLRGIPHAGDMTIRRFFSTPPFLILEEAPAREVVFGIAGRPGSLGARVSGPEDFRAFSLAGGMKAIANFRVDPRRDGALISTETYVATFGRRSTWLFRAYWLVVGPFSALIRREFLRAARKRTRT